MIIERNPEPEGETYEPVRRRTFAGRARIQLRRSIRRVVSMSFEHPSIGIPAAVMVCYILFGTSR